MVLGWLFLALPHSMKRSASCVGDVDHSSRGAKKLQDLLGHGDSGAMVWLAAIPFGLYGLPERLVQRERPHGNRCHAGLL